jgi:hypothetical protein
MTIPLGSQFYLGPTPAMQRQQQALAAVGRLSCVEPVNVQWVDGALDVGGLETIAVLKQDSRTVTRSPGRRKPILREVLDALAAVAEERNHRYFGFFNADIEVTQAAVDTIQEEQRQSYAFSRMDFDERGDREIMTTGLDLFAFDVGWWRANRHRFRRYILGERCFDNVFAAIMMCHGNVLILNRRGEIRHEVHPTGPFGVFDEYNWYLATLDALYFSVWVNYWEHLTQARARGGSKAEELEIQRSMFVLQPSILTRARHAGRCLKAHWRFHRRRARWGQTMRSSAHAQS